MRVRGLSVILPLILLLAVALSLSAWLGARDPGPETGKRPDPGALTTEPPPDPDPFPSPPSSPATLTGHVEGDPEPPSAGAWISLSGADRELIAYLDEQANFVFHDVPHGVPLDLWLGPDPSGARICRLVRGVILSEGEHRFLTIVAGSESAVRGLVRSAAGEPLEGVRVAVLPPLADWRAEVPVAATTGEDGRFYVGFEGQSTPERVRLVIDHVAEGYMLEERLLEPAVGCSSEVELILKPGLTIAGQVLLPSGAPLAGAQVHILEEYEGDILVRRPSEGLVETDEEGRFTDNAHRPGVYRIFVSGELRGARYAAVIDGVIAGREDVAIKVPGFGALKLAFENEVTGEPVKVGSGDLEFIYGHTGEEERFERFASFDGQSEVDLPNIPEGHYRVRVITGGYEGFLSELLFVEAGSNPGLIRFRLKPT
jgi:hypothetical protein